MVHKINPIPCDCVHRDGSDRKHVAQVFCPWNIFTCMLGGFQPVPAHDAVACECRQVRGRVDFCEELLQ